MTVNVRSFGDGVFEALAEAVRGAQGGDCLAPVTVVVERSALGLATRRRLAAAGPVANVRFFTWASLAAQLAAGWLAAPGRRLATPALEHEAVRAVLAARPDGLLAGARDQPGTVRALTRTYRDLAGVPDGALDALAVQSRRAGEVIGVVRAARAALAHCDGLSDLLGAAASDVRRTPSEARALGALVVYLPGRATAAVLGLLDALATCLPVAVVAGATGDPLGDEPLRMLVAELGSEQAAVSPAMSVATPGDVSPPLATWVRSAPSADAEVLMALRHLMRRHGEGTPLERMALVHGGAAPYPRLVHDAAALAGIPLYGGSPRPLAQSVAGRVLLGFLALHDHDWRRDDVAAWLACGPLQHGGRAVPATEWDQLSCAAGVVAGLDQWQDRLGALARALRRRAQLAAGAAARDAADVAGRASADALRLDAQHADELAGFVAAAGDRLAALPASWAGWAAWARGVLVELLGGNARRATWPTQEIAAFDAVVEALGALAALEAVQGPDPSLADFRTALGTALDRPAPETTRFGQGLLVGRVADAVGLDLDVVCVVGMVDGAFFGRGHDDVLLPDREREHAGSTVPLRGPSHAEERRDYFAALAGARERVLSYARADQRQGRELRPARLLLDALEQLAGGGLRLFPRDVRDGVPASVAASCFQFVRSFAEAVRDDGDQHGEPLSVVDWSLRSLARLEHAGGSVARHQLVAGDPVLRDALVVRAARRSHRFTRFDGLVSSDGLVTRGGLALTSAPQAATTLEQYARCPRSYLLSSVLDVRVRTRPEAVLRLSSRERGDLIHAVLEQLVSREISLRRLGLAPPSLAENEQTAAELAAQEFARLEASGITGHRALWALERARILGDLREFVRADAAYRAASGAQPVAVELQFGWEDETAVAVDAGGGRVVRFRGRIDRIDHGAGGSVVVIDYKTGAASDVAPGDDPFAGGTRLQLPVYALAARQGHAPSAPLQVGYWYVGKRRSPDVLTADDELLRALGDVVRDMTDAIDGGQFPANPGTPDGDAARGAHCRNCDYDSMCPPDRTRSWQRKQTDAALGAYLHIIGPRRGSLPENEDADADADADAGAADEPGDGSRVAATRVSS